MNRLKVRDLVFLGKGPFSFTVAPGSCIGISGPSGSGKSLLLRAIADLDPHEGEVSLGEIICHRTRAPRWRRLIGMLPAESGWWADTVGEHFADAHKNRVVELAEGLGFPADVLSWSIQRLSSGERQRLAIIRLLVNEPRALLLDEPTASLDGGNTELVEELFGSYRREHGVPVIWVSHDPQQLRRVADRILAMRKQGDDDGAVLG